RRDLRRAKIETAELRKPATHTLKIVADCRWLCFVSTPADVERLNNRVIPYVPPGVVGQPTMFDQPARRMESRQRLKPAHRGVSLTGSEMHQQHTEAMSVASPECAVVTRRAGHGPLMNVRHRASLGDWPQRFRRQQARGRVGPIDYEFGPSRFVD